MGDEILELNFFDKLRKGIATIESATREFRFQVEREFNRHGGLTDAELTRIRQFDQDIRSLYVTVLTECDRIKESESPLDQAERDIINLDRDIEQFINESGLKKMGYKPWINPRPIQLVSDDETMKDDQPDRATLPTPTVAKTMALSTHKSGRKLLAADKNLGRTPQPADFGITNHKRFTMLPKSMLKRDPPKPPTELPEPKFEPKFEPKLEKSTIATSFTKLPEPSIPKSTYNPFNSECTTVFMLPSVNAARYDLPCNDYRTKAKPILDETPPRQNNDNYSQDHITVEFTPGLTTRRPAGIRRVKPKEMPIPEPPKPQLSNGATLNITNGNGDKTMAEVTRSLKEINVDYERHFPETPKQPPRSKKVQDSAHVVKSVRKDMGDTPKMPMPSVDIDYKKLLARK